MTRLPATSLLTRVTQHDSPEADRRPLDLGLIRRLYTYTHAYAARRNWLLLLVVLRRSSYRP